MIHTAFCCHYFLFVFVIVNHYSHYCIVILLHHYFTMRLLGCRCWPAGWLACWDLRSTMRPVGSAEAQQSRAHPRVHGVPLLAAAAGRLFAVASPDPVKINSFSLSLSPLSVVLLWCRFYQS